MSWNRSKSEVSAAEPARGRSGARPPRRRRVPPVLLVAFVLLVLAAGVWWVVRGPAHPAGPAQKARRGRIAEASPAAPASSAAAQHAALPRPDARRAGPTNRVELTKNVKPPTVLGCNYYECVSGGRPLFARPVFTNSAENIIGGLLAARPGERFVPVELGEDFDEDFKASLGSPIEVSDDDDHDTAMLKAAVAKAKDQIAAGMKAGRRPSEVVTSMRDEMNKIADYRDLLQADFDRVKETGTAHQIEAYLKEANQLLDEFGAEHLDLPDDEVEEINRRLEKSPGDAGEDK